MLINDYRVLGCQRVCVMIFYVETDPRRHIPIPGDQADPPQHIHNVESFSFRSWLVRDASDDRVDDGSKGSRLRFLLKRKTASK